MTSLASELDEIDDASEAPLEVRAERLGAILQKLYGYPQDDPDVLYAEGYCQYFFPDRLSSPERQHEVEAALSRALTLRPNFQRARLYLGHHFYDLGRFEEARTCFDAITAESLPDLLLIKARELSVCCSLLVDGPEASLPRLHDFRKIAEAASEYDVLPIHLIEAAHRALPRCTDKSVIMKILKELRLLIATIRQESIFDNDLRKLHELLLR